MFIVKNRNIFFIISGLLVAGALFSLFFFGLKLSSDFLGGSLLEVAYQTERPVIEEIRSSLAESSLANFSALPAGESNLIIRTNFISSAEKEEILSTLSADGKHKLSEVQFSAIGPSLGKELQKKGLIAISLVVALIILFIAFVFRQISYPVKSWKYGIIAIVALTHDLIISIGAMALLGYFYSAEADALFLTALLAILGLSINDTIVIFDRIRENLRLKTSSTFEQAIGVSLDQSFNRSVNTTLTTILVLISMALFGPESTRYFSIILLVGMTVGTYSSIFLCAPLLVVWEKK